MAEPKERALLGSRATSDNASSGISRAHELCDGVGRHDIKAGDWTLDLTTRRHLVISARDNGCSSRDSEEDLGFPQRVPSHDGAPAPQLRSRFSTRALRYYGGNVTSDSGIRGEASRNAELAKTHRNWFYPA
jgi:hypothetical protein